MTNTWTNLRSVLLDENLDNRPNYEEKLNDYLDTVKKTLNIIEIMLKVLFKPPIKFNLLHEKYMTFKLIKINYIVVL